MNKDIIQIVSTEGFYPSDSVASDFLLLYKNCKIRIDPSKSYYKKLKRSGCYANNEFERQEKLIKNTDLLLVTHFHSDHVSGVDFLNYTDEYPISIYGKDVKKVKYTKILEEKTNSFPMADYLYISDYKGIEIELRSFKHGRYKGIDMGKVITSYFNNNHKLIISSDVSGPEFKDARNYIIEKDPDFLILDGPFNYLYNINPFKRKDPELSKKIKNKINKEIKKSYYNLERIIKDTENLSEILLIHHFVRNMNINELKSSKKFTDLIDLSKEYGVKIFLPQDVKKGLIKF